MSRVLEAIYEDGVLKPLEHPGLAEHERVFLEVRSAAEADATLRAWQGVFEGLSDEDVDEVARIALESWRSEAEPPGVTPADPG